MSDVKIVCLFHSDYENFPRAKKQIEALAAQDSSSVTAIGPWLNDDEPEQLDFNGAEINHYSPPITFPDVHVLKILNVLVSMLVVLHAVYRRERADIYHCIGVYALFIGVVFSLFSSSQTIYDAPEDYGCQINITYPGLEGSLLSWGIRKIERILARFPIVVFTVNSIDKVPYKRLKSVNEETYILENVPKLSEFENIDNRSNPLTEYENRPILVYVGGLSEQWGGDKMIDVMNHVSETHPEALLVIIGGATDRYMDHLHTRVKGLGLEDMVKLLGPVEYDKTANYLANADIGVQFYQEGPWNSRSMASSTIFRYMGFGLPLVVTDLPGMGNQIQEYECGIAPSVEDERVLANAVRRFIDDEELAKELGRQGKILIETRFNWEIEREKFLRHVPLGTEKRSEKDLPR